MNLSEKSFYRIPGKNNKLLELIAFISHIIIAV